mmetsp:Transcript_72415/g.172589  ORF Transcript_72415/g.172589 Transcript_72415/m.172589 type:complete len:563 (-) Transcript_72415:93-1781(-)
MIDFSELAEKDLEAVDSEDDRYQLPGSSQRKQITLRTPLARPPSIGQRKMQVLVLHGRQSNANLAAFQMAGMKSALGKEVDIHYLDGDVVWKYRPGWDLHDADEMTVKLAKGKPFFDWFSHETDDKIERLDIFRQQDPNANIYYKDPEKAVQKVLSFCKEHAPIDVVVGIFEGAIVASLVVAHCMEAGLSVPWRMNVFFGGLPIRDARYSLPLERSKSKLPVVCVCGTVDEYYYFNRTGASRPTKGKRITVQEDYYENALVLQHPGGHSLPKGAESQELYSRVVEEMKWHCGLLSKLPKKVPSVPKPLSAPLLDWMMHERKLKVVALCGGHSCTETLKFQCARLRQAIGKDVAEWVYLEGTAPWHPAPQEPELTETEVKLANGRQLKNWYDDYVHAPEGDRRKFRDQQFDWKLDVEYYDIPKKLEEFQAELEQHKPFDVIVAFSQGTIFTQLLLGCLRKQGQEIPWRINLFFAGMHIRDKQWEHLYDTPSDLPTVLVFGKDDEFYDYQRTGLGTGRVIEKCFESPIVLEHAQGHVFPTDDPTASEIYGRCASEVWKWCGGKP